MAQSYSITVANTTAKLGTDRKAESTFTVTNTSDRRIRGQLKLRSLDDTQSAWLTFAGEKDRTLQIERVFEVRGTQQVAVTISVPSSVPPGKYTFRIDAISAEQPDDDYTEGQVVSIEIPSPAIQIEPPRWRLYALLAMAAVIVIGGALWMFIPRGVVVPDGLSGHPFADASSAVKAVGLEPVRKDEATNTAPPGTVVAQDPPSGTRVKKGSMVTLTAAAAIPASQPGSVAAFTPMVNGVALDYCLHWGASCGKPAADAFCIQKGFAQAISLLVTPNNPPTYVIGDNKQCTAPNCTRLSQVTCAKNNTSALTGAAARSIHQYLLMRGLEK